MSLTDEQAQAAFAPGSVAVVAGAGTGKTYMLTHRYRHHLAGGLSPLEIVAVTFTERAAAELRARVRRALETSGTESDTLAELEAAPVGTLHALAARICRDHPDAAGVPADFGMLDDLERSVWLGEAFTGALGTLELSEETLALLPYERLREVLWALVQEPSLAEAAFAHSPAEWPEQVAAARRAATDTLVQNLAWQEAVLTLQACAGAPGDLIETARQHALAGFGALGAGDSRAALIHFAAVKRTGGSKKNWPGDTLATVKNALETVQTMTKAAEKEGLLALELGPADAQLETLLPVLQDAFSRVQAHLSAAKREARVLDFADLELHALKALEHESVREHYRKRWRAFLIDEFQDTSPVQAQLLARLTAGATVTLVGDEQQAIYGFRGADAAVFGEARAELAAGGGSLLALSESFRTHAPLVSATNTLFAPVLAEHRALRAWRQDAPTPAPHVTLHAVSAEKGVGKAVRRVQEARTLAETLLRLVTDETPVHDPETDALRPLRWGDVAVLTRTWRPLETFSEVFSALGIPVVHTGGGNLLETREAKDGLALVRVLADPQDDLALVALLRSPFFAVDDRTLTRFAQSLGTGTSWWDALQVTDLLAAADGRLETARTTLSALLNGRRRDAPSRLLARADLLTGYSAVLANLPGAARRGADWAGFIDLVRRLEGGLADIFTVARRLRRLLQANTDLPRPTLAAGDAAALMTVHRAKGLEWPLVVLADLDYRGRSQEAAVLIDRHRGVALCSEDSEGLLEPALYTLLKAEARADEDEEARRTLYVALTRARDRLVLSATEAKGGGLELLAPGLAALGLVCKEVPHDPALSLYPTPQPPEPPPEPPEVTDDALWSQSPTALGYYARFVENRTAAPAPSVPTDAWAEVLAWTAELGEEWLPHLEALRDAGLEPPDPDSVGRELTISGAATPYSAVAVWACAGVDIALADAAVPNLAYDQRLLRLEPDAPPETTVTLVQHALNQQSSNQHAAEG